MTIFFLLNGVAVVFLLYVLVNFWKEGARTAHGGMRVSKFQSLHECRPKVFVVTRPPVYETGRPGKRSLIQFPAPQSRPEENQIGGESAQGGGNAALRKRSA